MIWGPETVVSMAMADTCWHQDLSRSTQWQTTSAGPLFGDLPRLSSNEGDAVGCWPFKGKQIGIDWGHYFYVQVFQNHLKSLHSQCDFLLLHWFATNLCCDSFWARWLLLVPIARRASLAAIASMTRACRWKVAWRWREPGHSRGFRCLRTLVGEVSTPMAIYCTFPFFWWCLVVSIWEQIKIIGTRWGVLTSAQFWAKKIYESLS